MKIVDIMNDWFDEVKDLKQRIEKLEQRQRSTDESIWALSMKQIDPSCQEFLKRLDAIANTMQAIRMFEKGKQVSDFNEPKPTFYRGQEVEIRPGDFWVAGIYVDTKEDTKYKHGVYVFVTRMVEWWPDENIRPKQEDNK